MEKTICSIMAGLMIAGCSYLPRKEYTVKQDFKIIVEDLREMKNYYPGDKNITHKLGGHFWSDGKNTEIHVPYGNKGQPDFEILGHEIWHLKELGGHYHK